MLESIPAAWPDSLVSSGVIVKMNTDSGIERAIIDAELENRGFRIIP
jgi:hypothetical protein